MNNDVQLNARVAQLVYNDAQNDARVLKESGSAQEAGAQVKVFAISYRRLARAAGEVKIGNVHVQRIKEFLPTGLVPQPLVGPLKKLLGEDWTSTPQPASKPVNKPVAKPAPAKTITPPKSRPPAQGLERLRRPVRDGLIEIAKRAYGPVRLLDWWMRLLKPVADFRPDIIHANDANTLVPAIILGAWLKVPVVYDSHELWRHRNIRADRVVAPYVEAAIETIGVKRAAGVITVSDSIADWLQDHYHLAKRPAIVRNIPRREYTAGAGRLRELAGLDEQAKVLAYAGRITTARGLEEALVALSELDDNIHLVVLGYGVPEYLAKLHKIASTHGVNDRFHIVGPLAPEEVAGALKDADLSLVHVRPTVLSYRFALPNKLFESIHAGLPVVAADLPDLARIVRDYGIGEVFDGEDPHAFAMAIRTVLADPTPYRRNAEKAADDLTWENEAAVLCGVYADALAKKRDRGSAKNFRRALTETSAVNS